MNISKRCAMLAVVTFTNGCMMSTMPTNPTGTPNADLEFCSEVNKKARGLANHHSTAGWTFTALGAAAAGVGTTMTAANAGAGGNATASYTGTGLTLGAAFLGALAIASFSRANQSAELAGATSEAIGDRLGGVANEKQTFARCARAVSKWELGKADANGFAPKVPENGQNGRGAGGGASGSGAQGSGAPGEPAGG